MDGEKYSLALDKCN